MRPAPMTPALHWVFIVCTDGAGSGPAGERPVSGRGMNNPDTGRENPMTTNRHTRRNT
jgi:hypothetical protein